MNETTVFLYENALGVVRFAYESPFWITDIPEISSVEIDIASIRGREQIGETITNQIVQPKEFTMDGVIFDPIPESREHLLRVMAPLVKSTLTVINGEEMWYLDVVPQSTPAIDSGNGMQNFQVSLYASYPYWQTTDTYARQVAGLTAKFKFPFYTGGSWYISEFSDNYFTTLTNLGNVPSGIKVTFSARSSIQNPELMHMGTSKKIAIEKRMELGEKVIVSTFYGDKSVIVVDSKGNCTNGFKYLSIDSDLSFELLPGDNLLRGDSLSNRQGLNIQIEAPLGVKSGV